MPPRNPVDAENPVSSIPIYESPSSVAIVGEGTRLSPVKT